jgi:hypothetical protein
MRETRSVTAVTRVHKNPPSKKSAAIWISPRPSPLASLNILSKRTAHCALEEISHERRRRKIDKARACFENRSFNSLRGKAFL